MPIKNPRRKKQIEQFTDKDHRVMSEYYELMEREISREKLLKEMKLLIAEDKDFYDPYLVVADILFSMGKIDEANGIVKTAYEGAMKKIVDAEGKWPKEMMWGWMENRHLMRAIERYAFLCWEKGDTEEALVIFRNFLRVNPNDNQGVRNYILAIRMGLDIDKWDKQFLADNPVQDGALDAIKLHDWFKNNAKKGSIFFTIFQTFMSGPNNTPYYGDYPRDFFDFIVIDECHRGGANDESNWRGIMEYFSPAVQLGLTATPKRQDNIDTYRYFGEPVYTYSLKQGINDGFLTPFRVRIIKTTLDEYLYTTDDEVVEGEVEENRIYVEDDFAKGRIEIIEREEERVKIMLKEINKNDKTLVFCSTQAHALLIRDLINKHKESSDPFYCVRVTANDGARGDQFLAEFRDNEKTIPTILTTSQKLSTGVDARNVRNIVLMRPVNSMIEFKQIVGRGTRLYEDKEYFTIIDFVDAYKHFTDPEWDGEPIAKIIEDEGKRERYDEEGKKPKPMRFRDGDELEEEDVPEPPKKLKIKLADGKVREIQHMISTLFYSAAGRPISGEEFLKNIYGELPGFFKTEEQLRKIWSAPKTRKAFLEKIEQAGYGKGELENLQKLVDAKDSDLFDVLAYVAFASPLITRKERADKTEPLIVKGLDDKQREFLDFVLSKYVEVGEEELSEEKLPELIRLKYQAVTDAEEALGGVKKIRMSFFELQKGLYSKVGR